MAFQGNHAAATRFKLSDRFREIASVAETAEMGRNIDWALAPILALSGDFNSPCTCLTSMLAYLSFRRPDIVTDTKLSVTSGCLELDSTLNGVQASIHAI